MSSSHFSSGTPRPRPRQLPGLGCAHRRRRQASLLPETCAQHQPESPDCHPLLVMKTCWPSPIRSATTPLISGPISRPMRVEDERATGARRRRRGSGGPEKPSKLPGGQRSSRSPVISPVSSGRNRVRRRSGWIDPPRRTRRDFRGRSAILEPICSPFSPCEPAHRHALHDTERRDELAIVALTGEDSWSG